MKILDRIKLKIPETIGRDFLFKLMDGKLNPQLERLLLEKRPICIESIMPKAIYSNFEIEKIIGDHVYFKSGNIFKGPNISKILRGSITTTIFVTTLGSKIDEIIKIENAGGDILATIVMDAITTELLTVLSAHIAEIIKKEGIMQVLSLFA